MTRLSVLGWLLALITTGIYYLINYPSFDQGMKWAFSVFISSRHVADLAFRFGACLENTGFLCYRPAFLVTFSTFS